MDRGLREQSFACTASDRLIRLRSRDVSSTASKTLQTSVIAFSVYFRSEAPLLIPRPQELCFIKSVRMEKAKDLLEQTMMKIVDISTACGYPNVSYFCSSFREYYGISPQKFRESGDEMIEEK